MLRLLDLPIVLDLLFAKLLEIITIYYFELVEILHHDVSDLLVLEEKLDCVLVL